MAHFFSRLTQSTLRSQWCSNIVLYIDQNNTKGKPDYVSKRSGVLVPYTECTVLVCGALFLSMDILKLH
jgi:hypothetical protein